MRETTAIIGWVVGIQGLLGVIGREFTDAGRPWGLISKWWEVPTGGYVALAVVGAVLAVYGESTRRRKA